MLKAIPAHRHLRRPAKAGSSSALPQLSAGGRDEPKKKEAAGRAGGGGSYGLQATPGCVPGPPSVTFLLLTSFTRHFSG